MEEIRPKPESHAVMASDGGPHGDISWQRGALVVRQLAQQVWQVLVDTIPGHAVILSMLTDLGDPAALGIGRGHMADILAVMGTALRVLQGETVAPGRLRDELGRALSSAGTLKQRLQALPPEKQPMAQAILRIGAVTTGAEERLLQRLARQEASFEWWRP